MSKIKAKPFLKWAGGKSQLLSRFEAYFPSELKEGKFELYLEPFAGGGAVFFYIAQKYSLRYACLYDINKELILTYKVIQRDLDRLIEILMEYDKKYKRLNENDRKIFYYEVREEYNLKRHKVNYRRPSPLWVKRAGQLIFLNRTCYNGLFRVNREGEFNVPFGRYKNPKILDDENLKRVSFLLKKADIERADFSKVKTKVSANSFVYFDPPYKPISETASFTSYSKYIFDDKEQIRLASLYRELDRKGAKLMLSNSDPKNEDRENDFFDKLYEGYHIYRVDARRAINSNPAKRGNIKELIITNY
ncbi:MAG TPA: DNA adenine methylase [Candidatus Eremiobacteraeota bacterium]|nr:MAG: Modification methylase DpnIIA [bacterium ADurb.Bin363]HPZ07839.1 DNA adenine methylase [Candidatus Eremiobacteraeota bacterium]